MLTPFRPQILDRGRNLGRLSNRTLGVLRSLAYNSSQVPNYYKIDRNLIFDVEPEPFARGGFSDVQRGSLGDRLVAVKVLRMAHDNVPEVQKVRNPADPLFFFCTDQHTPVVAFLQGNHPLEEHISPQRPWSYRGRDRQLYREMLDDFRAHGER